MNYEAGPDSSSPPSTTSSSSEDFSLPSRSNSTQVKQNGSLKPNPASDQKETTLLKNPYRGMTPAEQSRVFDRWAHPESLEGLAAPAFVRASSLESHRPTIKRHPDVPHAVIIDSKMPGEGYAENVYMEAAKHGSEAYQIFNMERLLKKITTGEVKPQQGRITLAIGNPYAVQYGTRHVPTDTGEWLHDELGLNRAFFDGATLKNPLIEARRGDLTKLYHEASAMVDFHAVSSPESPSFSLTDPTSLHLARSLGAEFVLEVVDPEHLAFFQGTAGMFGSLQCKIPSVTFEAGFEDDKSTYLHGDDALYRFLHFAGVINELPELNFPNEPSTHAEITYIHEKKLAEKGISQDEITFAYAGEDGRRFKNMEFLPAGTEICSEEYVKGSVRVKSSFIVEDDSIIGLPTEYDRVKQKKDYVFVIAKVL